METTSDRLQKLRISANLSDEVVALEALQTDLKPDNNYQVQNNDPEEEWLAMAAENLGNDYNDDLVNPFPKVTPNQLLTRQDDLNQFTCYMFMRRFGWSEGINGETIQDVGSLGPHRGKLAIEKEAQCKGRLNELLDDCIKWYLSQPISQPLLGSLRHTFNQAANKPVVRNQTMVHVMEWLKHHMEDRGSHQHIEEVYQLMICGLTDIWSAIRNATVSRLPSVIEGFSLTELQVFFLSLAKICQSKDSTWQSIEGALMAITTILKRFQWTGKLVSPPFNMSGSTQFILKFGKQELNQLPEFLTSHMHTIVYPLLAHRQLSIRENATKAFSAFLSRCEFKEALASFTEAVTRLRHGTDSASEPASSASSQSSLPHLAVLRRDYKFLNAYEAEGLLGVCVYLIKHISPGFLLPCWPEYFSTFNLYLMHPASTVRQATSAVFKYLVAKDSNNPSVLKLVLQALCSDWDMNFDLLTKDMTSKATIYSSDLQSNGSDQNTSQQRIGNLVPSDGTGGTQGSENELRQQRKRHLSGGKYCSITSLCGLEQENTESLFCKAWEWREGRLFAYELIVKFLIINHIHYLFPSYALPPTKFDGTVSTDDSMTPSHQSRMAAHKPIQKSLSHGGSSLRQAFICQGIVRKTLTQDETLVEQDESAKRERSASAQDCKETPSQDEVRLMRGGSERRKKSIEEKRSRTLAEGHLYNKPMAKHYSYYTNTSSATPGKRQSTMTTASSLLEQTRDMDKRLNKQFNKGKSNTMCVNSPINPDVTNDMDSPPQDVTALLNSIQALETRPSGSTAMPDWLRHLDLDSMSNVLCQMLLQTIGCLGDTRWELRRMGQQALPLITECIRWYDMTILTTLWDAYLTPEATLGSYGCALALRFSIHHATKLDHFLQQPPASWKDPESCQRISMSIVDAVHEGLPRWCDVARQLVQRPIIDKLSVVALEILMLANSFFPHLVSERSTYEHIVVDCFQLIFHHAHPAHTNQLKHLGNVSAFQTPTNGCLSCCMRTGSVKPYPQQVEKHLLSEIHSLIPVYVRGCKVESAITLLPLLIHHVKEYSGDETIAKYMLDGSNVIVQRLTEEWASRKAGTNQFPSSVVDSVQLAFQEITLVLQDKTLDSSTVRQVLDMFLNLSRLVKGTDHLQLIFGAITHRLEVNGSVSSQLIKVQGSSGDEDSAFGSSNLAFMSNDIPASPVDDPRISDEDDAEDREPSARNHMLSESVALNASSSSSNTARLSVSGSEIENRALTPSGAGNDDDSGSDWDSWDEEEEDQTMTCSLFAEFMKKLKSQYSQVEHPGEPSPFQIELSNAKDQERKLITSLLS